MELASSFSVASSASEVTFGIFPVTRTHTTVAPLGVVVMLRELIVRSLIPLKVPCIEVDEAL